MSGESARRPGRPVGFAEFCVLARPRVCAALRTMTGGDRDVEDVLQEALILARHRWAEVGAYEFPEAWLVRVGLRMLLRWRRRRDRARFAGLDHDPPDDTADRALEHVERTTDLGAVIATLAPRQRDVITLHYRLDLPVAEIAEVLDMRPGTVRSLLTRGRDAMAARWDDGRPTA